MSNGMSDYTEVPVVGTVRLWCICAQCGTVLPIEDRDEGTDGGYNIYVDPHMCEEEKAT